nr:MAG TPA: hypothetical protein [Bacteriophage sp.]
MSLLKDSCFDCCIFLLYKSLVTLDKELNLPYLPTLF